MLPAQNTASSLYLGWSQLGSEGEQTVPASGVDLLEVAGEAHGALGGTPVPSPGSAVTWLWSELPQSAGTSLGRAPVGTGTDVPRPHHDLWQGRADLKPPQPWGQSWLLATAVCFVWQIPPCPLCFSPGIPVAALSVEDTSAPMHVFFLSLFLWLFILHHGGAGAWLHS